ncbi:MAG: HEAT repeat domain-containing protein [bacterium]
MRAAALLLVPVLLVAGPGLDSRTRGSLDAGFDALGVTAPELGFFKQWAVDSFFRLKAIDHLLDNPLEVAGYADSFASRFQERAADPLALAFLAWQETDAGIRPRDTVGLRRALAAEAGNALPGSEALPASVARAVNTALAGFRLGRRHLERATGRLTSRELGLLVGEATGFWTPEDSTRAKRQGELQRESGLEYDTTLEVKAETVLAILRRLDRRELALAGLVVAMAARDAEALLADAPPVFLTEGGPAGVPGVEGLVHFAAETEFGAVVVGSASDNHYHADFCLIIEPGGDDRYSGRAGGTVGIIGRPFAVVLDLAGDDLYRSDRSFSQGAALFGAGVLIDREGDDVYRAADHSQGAAVCGTGILCDRAGRDVYEAGSFGQGAGMVGVGIVADARGNDTYRAVYHAQAFASVWGYGLLLEEAGNDLYYAGGVHKHEPLLPKEYQSFAQGFSIGWRPDASGGIGFLCDVEGNDFYNAEVYAQGTSYWYALGVLWDGSGYDHYLAAQYSQGAGIHLAVGCLVDNDGNDSYYSRLGPSQGVGHDFSVGVLLDRGGNDVYHASGGQGYALTNSVGLLVDATGNDVYSSTEPLSLAGGRPARGFASIGNFLDLAGRDHYTAGSAGADFTSWTNGTLGAGQDIGSEPVPGDESDEGDTLALESDSLDQSLDSLFKYASTWEVGNARARVKQARARLHALGGRAIEWVAEHKADTKDGLESRAVELLVQEHPDTAKPHLFRLLRDGRPLARNNAAYWLGQLKDKARDATDSLLVALRDKRASPRRVVSALGDIGDSAVAPRILFLLRDDYEPSRIVTCEALGKLKARSAIPELIRALADRLFTVRSAAEDALGKVGRPAVEPLLAAVDGGRPPATGHVLRVLAGLVPELDTVADLELRVRLRRVFVARLGDEAPFLRLAAVGGLATMLDEPLRRELEAARAVETNRFVLAAYRKALGSE